jgi:hypothetical protein
MRENGLLARALAEIAARIAYLRESLRKIEEELTSLQS